MHVPINLANDKAVAYVEAGSGNWRRTTVRIQDSSLFALQLSCATCDKNISTRDPSGFWATHLKQCKDNGSRGQILNAGEQAVAPTYGTSSTLPLSKFVLRSAEGSVQSSQVNGVHHIMRAVHVFFENEHFKAAADVLGVKLPSRKVLSIINLDSMSEEVQDASSQSLGHLTFIDASSDGWRKKHCKVIFSILTKMRTYCDQFFGTLHAESISRGCVHAPPQTPVPLGRTACYMAC
jgi:hypothetical protein